MNLTVLGAAGATGVQLVEQAIAAGHRSRHLFGPGEPHPDQPQPPRCPRRRNRPRSGLPGHEREPTPSSASLAPEDR